MSNEVGAVVTALTIAITLLVGGLIVSSVGTAVDDSGRVQQAVLLESTGEEVRIGQLDGTDETVVNSRGYAVNLTGASDSFVESTSDVEFATDRTLSLGVWARVDAESASETMRVVQAGQAVGVVYNGTSATWDVTYYDTATRTTYLLTADASQQPATWANLQFVRNDTHAALYRNTTLADSVNVSDSATGGQVGAVNTSHFDGRIEEVRTDDAAWNATTRQRLDDDGVAPARTGTETMRAMFDQPGRGEQLLFYTPGALATSNVTYSQGLPGAEMVAKRNTLLAQADYEWDSAGPTIRPLSGGQLAGAPVAYVEYSQGTGEETMMDGVADAFQLAALLPVLLMAAVIVGVVSKFG